MASLTVPNPSFETNTTGWESNAAFGAYIPCTSFVRTTAKAMGGTASCLVTWPAPSGVTASWCDAPIAGHIVGRRYLAKMWVWVPVGAPDVRLDVAFVASGPTITTKGAWVQASVEWDATTDTHFIGVATFGPPVSGQQVYIDVLTVDEVIYTGAFKSPLNTPTPIQFLNSVNRGAFGPCNTPSPLNFLNSVNRGSWGPCSTQQVQADLTGMSHPPRQIKTASGWKSLQRVKWPG